MALVTIAAAAVVAAANRGGGGRRRRRAAAAAAAGTIPGGPALSPTPTPQPFLVEPGRHCRSRALSSSAAAFRPISISPPQGLVDEEFGRERPPPLQDGGQPDLQHILDDGRGRGGGRCRCCCCCGPRALPLLPAMALRRGEGRGHRCLCCPCVCC